MFLLVGMAAVVGAAFLIYHLVSPEADVPEEAPGPETTGEPALDDAAPTEEPPSE